MRDAVDERAGATKRGVRVQTAMSEARAALRSDGLERLAFGSNAVARLVREVSRARACGGGGDDERRARGRDGGSVRGFVRDGGAVVARLSAVDGDRSATLANLDVDIRRPCGRRRRERERITVLDDDSLTFSPVEIETVRDAVIGSNRRLDWGPSPRRRRRTRRRQTSPIRRSVQSRRRLDPAGARGQAQRQTLVRASGRRLRDGLRKPGRLRKASASRASLPLGSGGAFG